MATMLLETKLSAKSRDGLSSLLLRLVAVYATHNTCKKDY